MRRIVYVVAVVVVVFFAGSGPIWGCQLCDKLNGLGYKDYQIAKIIRSSATRLEAETRMRQLIARGPVEVKSQQSSKHLVTVEMPRTTQQTTPVQVAVIKNYPTPQVQAKQAIEMPRPTQPSQPIVIAAANSVQAEQIIEASLDDAATLLLPADQALQEQKEVAAKTEQVVKRAEFKKKEKNQKMADAGVTTAAIGTAFIPGVGPFIASGIILGRVAYGLFQNDPDEEE